MKIVIFGLTISSSWGNGHATPYRAILKALHRQGHQVSFYEKDVPYYARHRDFTECDFCELKLYGDWESIRDRAVREAAEADAVICASYCPEGARIADEVLGLSRPVRVFYDLDTPLTLAALERGEVEYIRSDQIPEFDLYLSFTGGETLSVLKSRWGARFAAPLYGCVDPDAHRRTEVRDDFRCNLSYMGTYAADRQSKLDALFLEPAREMPERQFVLAGSMYPRDWQWPGNVRRFEHVSPYEHPALYSSSRLTLNITRTDMSRWGYCPSGRFFEAAACGTPIVSDWFEGLDSFFTPQSELLIVRSADDVRAALDLPEAELTAVASRARERTLSEHTGERRAQELIALIEAAAKTTRNPQARSEVA